jgi:hypothetical protein
MIIIINDNNVAFKYADTVANTSERQASSPSPFPLPLSSSPSFVVQLLPLLMVSSSSF